MVFVTLETPHTRSTLRGTTAIVFGLHEPGGRVEYHDATNMEGFPKVPEHGPKGPRRKQKRATQGDIAANARNIPHCDKAGGAVRNYLPRPRNFLFNRKPVN